MDPKEQRKAATPGYSDYSGPSGAEGLRSRYRTIFEADLLDEQYGFREGLDAKMAIRRVYFHLKFGLREVVDGDLRDYFNTVPHGPLMKSVARRVTDGQVLSVIKAWLNAPVIEKTERGDRRTTTARDDHRGTPQGGVISPLLANVYFRRFALAWRRLPALSGAKLVNYADDFVICCPPGSGARALAKMNELMRRLGLEVNEEKTRLIRVPEERFDFPGTLSAFSTRELVDPTSAQRSLGDPSPVCSGRFTTKRRAGGAREPPKSVFSRSTGCFVDGAATSTRARYTRPTG